MSLTIRPAERSDAPSLSHICLETCIAGKSGAHLHNYPDLPGSVYAMPYVSLSPTTGFVLVDGNNVVGYILCATDTRAFEAEAAATWWPAIASKYPPSPPNPSLEYTPEDVRYIQLINNMYKASDVCIEFAPAHLHIDILEAYQGRGYGRKLIGVLVERLKELRVNGVWLGMDPKNLGAKLFYERLGFKRYDGMQDNEVGLQFENWKT